MLKFDAHVSEICKKASKQLTVLKRLDGFLTEQGKLVLFVCLFALRPKSTAMVIAGRSVDLTTLFSLAGLNKRLTSKDHWHLLWVNAYGFQ